MRLIDADALMNALGITDMDCRKCEWRDKEWNLCNRGSDFEDACCAIENAPTIEERKTGRWIPRCDRPKQEVFICSECGRFAYSPWTGNRRTQKKNWCKYRFCPNCGADMRGV